MPSPLASKIILYTHLQKNVNNTRITEKLDHFRIYFLNTGRTQILHYKRIYIQIYKMNTDWCKYVLIFWKTHRLKRFHKNNSYKIIQEISNSLQFWHEVMPKISLSNFDLATKKWNSQCSWFSCNNNNIKCFRVPEVQSPPKIPLLSLPFNSS